MKSQKSLQATCTVGVAYHVLAIKDSRTKELHGHAVHIFLLINVPTNKFTNCNRPTDKSGDFYTFWLLFVMVGPRPLLIRTKCHYNTGFQCVRWYINVHCRPRSTSRCRFSGNVV